MIKRKIYGIDPEILSGPFTIADIDIQENEKQKADLMATFKKHSVPYDNLLPYVMATAMDQYKVYIDSVIEQKLSIRKFFQRIARIAFWCILVIAIISAGYDTVSTVTASVGNMGMGVNYGNQ